MTPEQSAALVERLRESAFKVDIYDRHSELMVEAADLIESLTSKAGTDEVVEAREVVSQWSREAVEKLFWSWWWSDERGDAREAEAFHAGYRAALATCQPMVISGQSLEGTECHP